MFQGSFKDVYRKFQGCFLDVLWLLQGNFKSISRKFQKRLRKFQGNIKGASRKFHGCFNLDLRVFQVVLSRFLEYLKEV